MLYNCTKFTYYRKTKSTLQGARRYRFHNATIQKAFRNHVIPGKLETNIGDPPSKPTVFRQKQEELARALLEAKQELGALFGKSAKKALTTPCIKNDGPPVASKEIIAALQALNILRPRNPFSIMESAELKLKARLNKLVLPCAPELQNEKDWAAPSPTSSFSNKCKTQVEKEDGEQKIMPESNTDIARIEPTNNTQIFPKRDILKFNLPIISPQAFVLATDAVCASLADDLTKLCSSLNLKIQRQKSCLSQLEYLANLLSSVVRFPKTTTNIPEWMENTWPKLKKFMPTSIQCINDKDIQCWLTAHMNRVQQNKKKAGCKKNEMYDFCEDFIYDELPLPEDFIDERKVGYTLQDAENIFFKIGEFLEWNVSEKSTSLLKNTSKQFQQLIWDLQKLGLPRWFNKKKLNQLQSLPRAHPEHFIATSEDVVTANLLLKAAARGYSNFLHFEALDPYKLFYGFTTLSLQEEIKTHCTPGKFLTDQDTENLFDVQAAALRIQKYSIVSEKTKESSSLHQLVAHHKEESRFDGPLEWLEDGNRFVTWRWRKPVDCQLDHSTGKYTRNSDGVNPLLNTSQLRAIPLRITKLSYGGGGTKKLIFRIIVAVGDGRGFFGTASGFGITPSYALKDGTLKALQNAHYIDHDTSKVLCTPVQGTEYKTTVQFFYRSVKKGIRAKAKMLPLVHLMGFTNVAMRFRGKTKWPSRHRALRRALEHIQSRRTLANSTGKKYAHLAAPGDHWVHWPDRWFVPIAKEYKEKLNILQEKAKKNCQKRGRHHLVDIVPENMQTNLATLDKQSPSTCWTTLQNIHRAKAMKVYQTEMFSSATLLSWYLISFRPNEPIQNIVSMTEVTNPNEIIDNGHLHLYYDRLFPLSLLCEWLTYTRDVDLDLFSKREFSMSVSRGSDDFYFRWQSFSDIAQFKQKILTMSPVPHKMDIGAIYSLPIREKESGGALFRPVEKELVFDIDMNDYDDTRSCCKDKTVCTKCWKFLALAADILETALREDFGFHHIFWVFSGRRGIHGWVCDSKARKMPTEARAAIADYLNLVTGGSNQKKKVRLFRNTAHPMVRRAYERSLKLFPTLVREQNFFKNGKPLVSLVEDYMVECKAEIKEAFFHQKATKWDGSSLGLWELVLSCCLPRDRITPMELLLAVCYPRLDINVSKDIGHLLKAPFCIHQATGYVCVPIPPSKLLTFNPENAPRLSTLRAQYTNDPRVEATDLAPYIDYFRKQIVEPLLEENKKGKVIQQNIGSMQQDDEHLEEYLATGLAENENTTSPENAIDTWSFNNTCLSTKMDW